MPHPPRPSHPRLADVARALGVSITTVSNAFSRPDQLSPRLRAVVLARAEAMGYRGPGAEGRLLRTGHAGAIALYNPEPVPYLLTDPIARTFLGGLTAEAQARQFGLVILPAVPHTRHDRPRPPAALDVAAVDGIVLYSLADDDPVIRRALDRRRPVVGVDMSERTGMASVRVDDREGARAVASHLLALGHRQFGVIALPPGRDRMDRPGTPELLDRALILPTRERWRGYAAALTAAGVDPGAVAIHVAGVNERWRGRDAAETLLSIRPRPTALLCMSDVLALGALDACTARGVAVPDQVAVVGFDDLPGEAEASNLTTVRQNGEAKGRAAARRLLDSEAAPSMLGLELVVRSSCGSIR